MNFHKNVVLYVGIIIISIIATSEYSPSTTHIGQSSVLQSSREAGLSPALSCILHIVAFASVSTAMSSRAL